MSLGITWEGATTPATNTLPGFPGLDLDIELEPWTESKVKFDIIIYHVNMKWPKQY